MARQRKYATMTPEQIEEKKEELAPPPPVVEYIEDNTVPLHFIRPIEVYLSGKPYIGQDVIAENYSIASEIVRIAKEAFGNDILG